MNEQSFDTAEAQTNGKRSVIARILRPTKRRKQSSTPLKRKLWLWLVLPGLFLALAYQQLRSGPDLPAETLINRINAVPAACRPYLVDEIERHIRQSGRAVNEDSWGKIMKRIEPQSCTQAETQMMALTTWRRQAIQPPTESAITEPVKAPDTNGPIPEVTGQRTPDDSTARNRP